MTFYDTLSLAFRNLRQSRLRTFLTTLGVAIGIASLAGMVSLGVGLQDQVIGRLTQSGVFDSITVTGGGGGGPFGLGGRGGGRGGRAGGQARPTLPLDDDALAKIRALAHVTDVYPNLRVPVQLKVGEYSSVTTASGIPESSRGVGAFQTITHGTFFPDASAEAAMLSLDLATRINESDPASLIGQTATVSYAVASPATAPVPAEGGSPPASPASLVQRVERTLTIVGIVERDPDAGLGGGLAGVAGLMIPIAQARTINATMVTNAQSLLRGPSDQPRTYTAVTVRVNGAQHTQDVQTEIKALGLGAFSLNDALQGAKRAFLLLDILLAVIGSIALAVSSLGIVNTMIMSILERTREIGIMKAIGGSDKDVRGIFLVEAATIGLLGGISGLILGWGVGRIINIGANMYIESQGGTTGNLFSLPWWLIAGSLGFALLVSLIAGSYPARRAARLDPIQALRHE